MKKKLLLILMLANCMAISAQSSRYSAFSVSGNVQVKKDSHWVDVVKGMPLGAFDELKFFEKSSIKIIENKTNKIFKKAGSGVIVVRQLVNSAKSQSEGSLSTLTQAFTNGMSTKVKSNNRLCSVGASHRGNNTTITFEDSICSTIAYVVNAFLGTNSLLSDSAVVGTRIIDQDAYMICLENRTDLAYCINIVSVDKESKKCRLLLSPGIKHDQPYVILNSHTRVVLDDIEYAYNPEECLFVLISERLFDNEEVNAMLEHYPLDEGDELFKMRYFEIK